MGEIREVTREDLDLLRDYHGLTDVALRSRREPAEGLFIAEGEKVIRRAVAAGYPVRSLLVERKWVGGLAEVIESGSAPAYIADVDLLHDVTGYAVHRGALAAMERMPLPDPGTLIASARRVAVLEDVNNHTNVGAIFRSAAGLGVDAVLLNPGCADPLYRRSVRVSMGAVFAVPWARLDDWPGGLDLLRAQGFVVAALALRDDAADLDHLVARAPERLALMVGAEGDGLSRHAVSGADLVVRIPMAGGVDSLNVAAAAAVAFWATRVSPISPAAPRHRRTRPPTESW